MNHHILLHPLLHLLIYRYILNIWFLSDQFFNPFQIPDWFHHFIILKLLNKYSFHLSIYQNAKNFPYFAAIILDPFQIILAFLVLLH